MRLLAALVVLMCSIFVWLAWIFFYKRSLYHNTLHVSDRMNMWKKNSRNVNIIDSILNVELQAHNGDWHQNRIELSSIFSNEILLNDDGCLKYYIQDHKPIHKILFPLYSGPCKKLTISKCVMLSVNAPKYNDSRNETMNHLKRYGFPAVSVGFGYTRETIHKARFFNQVASTAERPELTLGMLEIFMNFESEPKGDQNAWLLFFEDDVRVVNVPEGTDLQTLQNVPYDAELVRPFWGSPQERKPLSEIQYHHSWGGGMNHALYISSTACRKVLNYAERHGWRYPADIDLYKLATGCPQYPSGIDGWGLTSSDRKNDISPLLSTEETIKMYHMDYSLYDQTSCGPIRVSLGLHSLTETLS